LLGAARAAHAERQEWEAVVELLQIELSLAPLERRPSLLDEYARVQSMQLFNDQEASKARAQLLELRPDDPSIQAAQQESAEKRARWQELCQTYLDEGASAPDPVYKSSMLMRAAEMELRFAEDELDLDRVVARLSEALSLDPNDETALYMLERIYRRKRAWDELSRVLSGGFEGASNPNLRLASGLKLARLERNKRGDASAAAAAYRKILELSPRHHEAYAFLADFYGREEDWEKLVQLYEQHLSHEDHGNPEHIGDMLQIAFLHAKKRDDLEAAQFWFERVRKLDAANPAAIDFFRVALTESGDEGRFLAILQAAQRISSDDAQKQKLAHEIAQLAEKQKDVQKAIDQYNAM
jgi:tetratricopeptide (TPR) repeat protein